MDNNELNYKILTEILNENVNKNNDRRKKSDWISKMATILSLCAWGIMLAVWIVLEMAAPEREHRFLTSFFDVTFGTTPVIRARWDNTLVYTAFVLLLVSLSTSVIAFLFNKMRMRRKSDKYKVSVFVVGGITLIALVAFIIRFWSVLF